MNDLEERVAQEQANLFRLVPKNEFQAKVKEMEQVFTLQGIAKLTETPYSTICRLHGENEFIRCRVSLAVKINKLYSYFKTMVKGMEKTNLEIGKFL